MRYKLIGKSGNIKVFKWFEIKQPAESVTLLGYERVQKLISMIKADFPGREFKFEVSVCST